MRQNKRTAKWRRDVEKNFLKAYEEQANALFRHCLVRVRDRELALDLVQETFSRTWLYVTEGKQVTYLRAFLFRVANNLIVDASRRKHSTSLDQLMEENGFEVADEDAIDPVHIPQQREALRYVASLDDIYRTVITMRYLENRTLQDIARTLGITENVVSVRLHRGLLKLAALMNRRMIPDISV